MNHLHFVGMQSHHLCRMIFPDNSRNSIACTLMEQYPPRTILPDDPLYAWRQAAGQRPPHLPSRPGNDCRISAGHERIRVAPRGRQRRAGRREPRHRCFFTLLLCLIPEGRCHAPWGWHQTGSGTYGGLSHTARGTAGIPKPHISTINQRCATALAMRQQAVICATGWPIVHHDSIPVRSRIRPPSNRSAA